MNFFVAFVSGSSEDGGFCQLPPKEPVRSNLPGAARGRWMMLRAQLSALAAISGLYHYQITKLHRPSLFISRDPFSFVRVAKELPAGIGCRDEASFSSPHLLARLHGLDAEEIPSCKGAECVQAIGAHIFINRDPWAQLRSHVSRTKQMMGSLVLQNHPPLCKIHEDS